MNFNIDNLRFVYFTNENNIPLLKLTLSNFFKHNNLEDTYISFEIFYVTMSDLIYSTPLANTNKESSILKN